MALEIIDPSGGLRGDIQAAIIASTVANVHRAGGPPQEVEEFMPDFGEETQPQSQEEMGMRLDLWCQLTNASQKK